MAYLYPIMFFKDWKQGYIEGEIFKPITQNEVRNIKPGWYYISNKGRVYSAVSNILLSPGMTIPGYACITVRTVEEKGLTFDVHRIEMLVFNRIPGCEFLEVNHKDGNKLNNDLSNLEWVTPSQNMIHASVNNLLPKGENHPNCTIPNEVVHKICELYINGYNYASISRMLNIHQGTIKDIITGKIRKDITSQYDIQIRVKNALTHEQVHEVCKILSENKGTHVKYLYRVIEERLNIIITDKIRFALLDIYGRKHNRYQYITSLYDY